MRIICAKMATQGMITGIGAIYKRLLNHRPVIQNEVQFFVKEFEGTRGNSDHQSLKATVDITNEVESLLQEIAQLSPLLKKITDQVHETNSSCDTIFTATERQLDLPSEVKLALDTDVSEHHTKVEAERDAINAQAQEKLKQLKSDITRVREARMKLQAKTTVAATRPGRGAIEANTVASTTAAAQSANTVTADTTSSGAQIDSTAAQPVGSTQSDITTSSGSSTSAQLATVTSTPALTTAGVDIPPGAASGGGVNSTVEPLSGADSASASVDTTSGVNSTVEPLGGADSASASVDTTGGSPVTISSEVVAGDVFTPSP